MVKEYFLHSAKLDLKNKNIPKYKFDTWEDFAGWILADSTPDIVYLVNIIDEVYVSDSIAYCIYFIEMFKNKFDNSIKEMEVFLQEYDSFEEAYILALSMQEIKENCYMRESSVKHNKLYAN